MAARIIAGLVLVAGAALLLVATLGDSSDDDTVAAASTGDDVASSTTLAEAPENFGPRKDLVNLDGWLNTDVNNFSEFDGKVLLVEMWTFGCSNCKARIPHNQTLYASTSRDDFEIIGVHAPEFNFEAEIPNIENAVVDLGVTWPVALDTEKTNFRAWQDGGRRFWPRTYVIDQNGDVRYDHIGEGRYEELSQTVNWLIENPPT